MSTTPGNAVYVAMIEVEPLPGCELCSGEVAGGYARCYAPAADAGAAEQAMAEKLGAERLRLVQVEWCEGFEDVAWEAPDDEEAAACAREALASGRVVIGRLDTWTEDTGPDDV